MAVLGFPEVGWGRATAQMIALADPKDDTLVKKPGSCPLSITAEATSVNLGEVPVLRFKR